MNNVGVVEYTTDMQTAAGLIEAKRAHEAAANLQKEKQGAVKKRKRERAEQIKAESRASLE